MQPISFHANVAADLSWPHQHRALMTKPQRKQVLSPSRVRRQKPTAVCHIIQSTPQGKEQETSHVDPSHWTGSYCFRNQWMTSLTRVPLDTFYVLSQSFSRLSPSYHDCCTPAAQHEIAERQI